VETEPEQPRRGLLDDRGALAGSGGEGGGAEGLGEGRGARDRSPGSRERSGEPDAGTLSGAADIVAIGAGAASTRALSDDVGVTPTGLGVGLTKSSSTRIAGKNAASIASNAARIDTPRSQGLRAG
jgi:hypothetical protein